MGENGGPDRSIYQEEKKGILFQARYDQQSLVGSFVSTNFKCINVTLVRYNQSLKGQ
jgi:hypothetical protein